MNKEDKEIKISFPMFTNLEEAELERKLDFHLDEFVNEINKTISRDKDILILKKVIEKQQKEIEELKDIIKTIRHELKGNIISKDEKGDYRPTKNLRKQEVYESYVKLITLLKANYIFKEDEDVIKELLDEYKW